MAKKIACAFAILCTLMPTSMSLHAATVVTERGIVCTQPIKKKVAHVAPRKNIFMHRHGYHGYHAGAALLAGLTIGTVIANADDVQPSQISSIKGADGVTYYFVNGQKSVLIDGNFVAVK